MSAKRTHPAGHTVPFEAACTLPVLKLGPKVSPEVNNATLRALRAHSRHDVALLAGTGPSAGELTVEQAGWFNRHADIWGMNQLLIHRLLVPRFYHVEVKGLVDGISSRSIWKVAFDEAKRRAYGETIFITPTREKEVGPMLLAGSPCPMGLVQYALKTVPTPCHELRTIVRDPVLVRHYCDSSISTILDLMLVKVATYRAVLVVGVDLGSPHHFWDTVPSYNASLHPVVRSFDKLVTTKNRYGVTRSQLSAYAREHGLSGMADAEALLRAIPALASPDALDTMVETNRHIHPTARRGIAVFWEHVIKAHACEVRFVNISPASLLKLVPGMSTLPPASQPGAGNDLKDVLAGGEISQLVSAAGAKNAVSCTPGVHRPLHRSR